MEPWFNEGAYHVPGLLQLRAAMAPKTGQPANRQAFLPLGDAYHFCSLMHNTFARFPAFNFCSFPCMQLLLVPTHATLVRVCFPGLHTTGVWRRSHLDAYAVVV